MQDQPFKQNLNASQTQSAYQQQGATYNNAQNSGVQQNAVGQNAMAASDVKVNVRSPYQRKVEVVQAPFSRGGANANNFAQGQAFSNGAPYQDNDNVGHKVELPDELPDIGYSGQSLTSAFDNITGSKPNAVPDVMLQMGMPNKSPYQGQSSNQAAAQMAQAPQYQQAANTQPLQQAAQAQAPAQASFSQAAQQNAQEGFKGAGAVNSEESANAPQNAKANAAQDNAEPTQSIADREQQRLNAIKEEQNAKVVSKLVNRVLGSNVGAAPQGEASDTSSATPSNSFESYPGQFDKLMNEPINNDDRVAHPVSAIDALIKKIQEKTGIDIDAIETSPYDAYVLRQEEAREVAREVSKRKEEYYQNYLNEMKRLSKVDSECTFDKLTHDENNKAAFMMAHQFLDLITPNPSNALLLLFGELGSGKTMLCHAIANEYISRKGRERNNSNYDPELPMVMISSFEDIKRSCYFSYNETYEERVERERRFDNLCKIDLLIIDCLCNDNTAFENYNQKIFNELLRRRVDRNLPIILTTSVNLQSLHRAIGDLCYEGIRCYKVIATALTGGSRRPFIYFNGSLLP